MTLPFPLEEDNYKFHKSLHMDCDLIQNEYGQFDMHFENKDLVQDYGKDSLRNGIIIAIMTRYEELYTNPTYYEFGCLIHTLIKANKSKMIMYKIENYIKNTLIKMRRVRKVNQITVTETKENDYSYDVFFNVTSINDEVITGELSI